MAYNPNICVIPAPLSESSLSGAGKAVQCMESACTKFYEERRAICFEKSPPGLILEVPATSLSWIVKISYKKLEVETIFQGSKLPDLVEKVYDSIGLKDSQRQYWDIYLIGQLLPKPADYSTTLKVCGQDFTARSDCFQLHYFVNPGNEVKVELTVRGNAASPPIPQPAAAGRVFFSAPVLLC